MGLPSGCCPHGNVPPWHSHHDYPEGLTNQTDVPSGSRCTPVRLYARTRPTAFKQGLDLLFAIPKRKCNVLYAVCVRHTGNSIFAPAESPRSSVIVGEVAPGVTIFAVILSDYTRRKWALACYLPIDIMVCKLSPVAHCLSAYANPRAFSTSNMYVLELPEALTHHIWSPALFSVSRNFLKSWSKVGEILPSNTWFSRGLALGASLPLW